MVNTGQLWLLETGAKHWSSVENRWSGRRESNPRSQLGNLISYERRENRQPRQLEYDLRYSAKKLQHRYYRDCIERIYVLVCGPIPQRTGGRRCFYSDPRLPQR